MTVIVVAISLGLALLIIGWVSRRPWGRWWDLGPHSNLQEQTATLIMPSGGFCFLFIGLGVLFEGIYPLYIAFSFLGVIWMFIGLWTVCSLPVPERFLVEDSYIRRSRQEWRRRWRRRWRRWRSGGESEPDSPAEVQRRIAARRATNPEPLAHFEPDVEVREFWRVDDKRQAESEEVH